MASFSLSWAQTTYASYLAEGFEGSTTLSGNSCTATNSNETANASARTGSKVCYAYPSSASSTARYVGVGGNLTAPKNHYIHAIVWVKGDNVAEGKVQHQIGPYGTTPATDYVNTTTSYTRCTITPLKSGGSAKQVRLYFISNNGTPVAHFWYDDFIMYTSSADVPTDLTKPSQPTSASATISTISWTNGSDTGDGATGIQKTLIWKRTSGSENDLTLNDQGIYSLTSTEGPSTDQSDHWTLISASVNSDATSYSSTFISGEVYAIVHRDLAYNYSSPTYVTIPVAATYNATFSSTKGTAPSSVEAVTHVTLSEITGVDDWGNVGWKANENVTVDDATVTAGTLIDNGKVAYLSANTTFTAQWAAAYDVTFNKGAATGTAPASFQKWEGAEFELPGQGDMVAPSGKVFGGWITGGTKYAAGATYTMTDVAVEFKAIWKNIPQTIFHYQWTGSSTQPAVNDVLNGTGGTITVERKDGSEKTLSTESAAFVASVPADMRFSGETNKAVKMGTNDVWFHVALTTGKFQTGDTIKMCGYETCIISSSSTNDGNISAGVVTGTDKSNCNVASCVFPSIASSDLFIRRLSSDVNFGFAAMKVLRPLYDITVDENIEHGSVVAKVGEETATTASMGKTVILTVTPDGGYQIASVKYNDGEDHVLELVDSKYSFTMPAKDVTVSATFSVTTAIDNTADEAKAVKFFENGQLLIRRGDKVYNATGQLIR